MPCVAISGKGSCTHRIPVHRTNDWLVCGFYPILEVLEIFAVVSADKVELSLLLDVGTSLVSRFSLMNKSRAEVHAPQNALLFPVMMIAPMVGSLS